MKNKYYWHTLACLLFVVPLIGINNLKTNNNLLDWLPKDHRDVQKVLSERKDGLLKREILIGLHFLENIQTEKVQNYLKEIENRVEPQVNHYSLKVLADNKLLIVVSLIGKGDNFDKRENKFIKFINSLDLFSHQHSLLTEEAKFAGFGVFANTFNSLIFEEGLISLGITYLLIAIFLAWQLKSVVHLIFASIILTMSSFTCHGIMGMLNIPLNMMTIAVSSLILIIGIADILHIYHFLKQNPQSSLIKVFIPCFLTTLTTSVGFASLGFSNLPIIRDFGISSAIGIFAALFWSFYAYGVFKNRILKLIPEKETQLNNKALIFNWVKNKKWPFSTLFVLTIIIAFYLIPKLKIDTNLLDYIPKNHLMLKHIDWFYDNSFATNRIDLRFENKYSKKNDLIKNTKILDSILSEFGYQDFFIKNADKLFSEEKQRFIIYSVGSPNNLSSIQLETWNNELLNLNWEGYKPMLGGFSSLFTLIFKEVLDTQVSSGLFSFILIILILIIIMRKKRYIVAGVLTNILPLAVMFSVMAWWKFDLDITTVCVTVLTLGIIVDDTIHLLWAIKSSNGEVTILEENIKECISAITSTTIILGIGFFALSLSAIKSLALFGSVLSVGIFSAWIFDILIISWILPKNIKSWT